MKRDIFLKRMARGSREIIDFPDEDSIFRKYGCNKKDRTEDDVLLYKNLYDRLEARNKLRNLKYLTKFIDFKCDFDDKGKCRRIREDKDKSFWSAPKCCCGECALHMGYFEFIPKKSVQYYADLFDARDGYWEKGKGCKIENPADRSQTCVHYSCNSDKQFSASMDTLGHELRCLDRDIIKSHHKEKEIKRRIILEKLRKEYENDEKDLT